MRFPRENVRFALFGLGRDASRIQPAAWWHVRPTTAGAHARADSTSAGARNSYEECITHSSAREVVGPCVHHVGHSHRGLRRYEARPLDGQLPTAWTACFGLSICLLSLLAARFSNRLSAQLPRRCDICLIVVVRRGAVSLRIPFPARLNACFVYTSSSGLIPNPATLLSLASAPEAQRPRRMGGEIRRGVYATACPRRTTIHTKLV